MIETRRVKLSDVAGEAGVSVTTASYILNGHGARMRIAADTHERVLAAAASLGYRPNRSARNLRTRRTATLGLVCDQVASDPYGSGMLAGAIAAARTLDHLLVLGESGGDPDLERLLIEEMVERDVDGIVYATATARTVSTPASLRGVRTVLLNCEDAASPAPCVVPDDEGGGRLAATTLLEAGLRDVWAVGEDTTPEATAGRRRLLGLSEVLAAHDVALGGVVTCDWSVVESHAATRRWLDDGGRADALVCLNDRVALGAYQALAEVGLRIPEDVAVVSFDGSALAGWLRPALTSVELPFAELGAVAVRRLLDPTDLGGTTRVPMPLVRGASISGG